jgi:chromate transporter
MEREGSRSEITEGVSQPASLGELAFLFLKLGTIAFGGPAAHIAMMEDEVVRRRRWLTREEFLDLLGATNLIPGPNSTEMAIHIGHRKAGWIGLLIAGSCFIIPAAVIVTGFAWAYVRYGTVPQAGALLYGVKPVIIAIVLQALWGFARAALKTGLLLVIGAAGTILGFWGINELAILLGAGVVVGIGNHLTNRMKRRNLLSRSAPFILIVPITQAAAAGVSTAASVGLWPLFLFFLKVGSVLYGSGYVLLAFLRADLVERWHWLSDTQLLDAVAVGQMTPGPVFTTATFIGYVLGGFDGAIVATAGIFIPAFFFVALSGPLVPRIRGSATAGAFLDGVNAASLALMAVVIWQLANAAVVDLTTVALLAISLILLVRYRLNSVWLVIGGGTVGLLSHFHW